jgi:hypothetical protein
MNDHINDRVTVKKIAGQVTGLIRLALNKSITPKHNRSGSSDDSQNKRDYCQYDQHVDQSSDTVDENA